jgi:hypothetical protein
MFNLHTNSLTQQLSNFLNNWLNFVFEKAKNIQKNSLDPKFTIEQALITVLADSTCSSVLSLRKRFLQEFALDIPNSAHEFIDMRINHAISEAYSVAKLDSHRLSYENLFYITESRSMVLDALPDNLFDQFSKLTGKHKWTTSKVVLHKLKHGLTPAESQIIYRIRLVDADNNLQFCLFSTGEDQHFGIVQNELYYSLGDTSFAQKYVPNVDETNSWLRKIEAFYTMERLLSREFENDRQTTTHCEFTELNHRCMMAMKLACSLVHHESWMPDQNPYRPNNVWQAMGPEYLCRTAFLNIAYAEHALQKHERYDVQRFSGISKVEGEYIDVSRKTHRIPKCVHGYHADSKNYPIGKLVPFTMEMIESHFSKEFDLDRKVCFTDIGK